MPRVHLFVNVHRAGKLHVKDRRIWYMAKKQALPAIELIQRLQARDKAAFGILYDDYFHSLRSVVYRMVMNKSLAEDLLQDIFLKIWKYINNYDAEKGTLFTWMSNIARNVCIDYLRSKHHQQKITIIEKDYDYNEIVAAILPPADRVTIGELYKIVQKLNFAQAQVIEMVFFRGFTHEETAEILGIALGTVKTRCRSGLRNLRMMYNS